MQTHERKPSCQKTGADAQNIPIRGRLKGHRLTFIRRLQCATWAFADRKQLRRRNMVCKRSPRYPEREYFAHLDGKNDNMPPRNPEGDIGTMSRRKPKHAHQNPDTQTPKGTRQPSEWIGTNLRPQIGKKRQGGRRLVKVEPNCDALDKLSGLQVRRGIIQAES